MQEATNTSVSIVMATWQGQRFLRAQLDSLRAQTRLADELVVCDDASTDETPQILQRFASGSARRVRALRQGRRVGYTANFMTAAAQATGDLLLFCDQDDVWHPDKIATVLAAAENDPAAELFGHDIEIIGPGEAPIPSFFAHLEASGLGPWACIKGHTLAVRRRFLQRWGHPPPGAFSHDQWVTLLATLSGTRRYLGDRLVTHRFHDRNASRWLPTSADLYGLDDDERRGGLPPAESLLALCVSRSALPRLDLLRDVLLNRASAADPWRAGALEAVARQRARVVRASGEPG
jgi:glycosyltransferase involved in cell wall biosynthesis